jgi:hypothetical protein
MFCIVIVLQFQAHSNQTRQPKTYGQNGHFAQIYRYFIFFIYAFVPERKKLQAVSTTACHGISGQIQKLQTGGDYDRSQKRHADKGHKKQQTIFLTHLLRWLPVSAFLRRSPSYQCHKASTSSVPQIEKEQSIHRLDH